MKKIILSVAITIGSLLNIHAQKANAVKQGETAQQKAKQLIDKMTTACNLKSEQVTRLTIAFTEYYTKHDALKKQKSILDKSSYADRSEAMKKTRDAVLKSTLTAAQYKLWTNAKEKQKKEAKKDKSEG